MCKCEFVPVSNFSRRQVIRRFTHGHGCVVIVCGEHGRRVFLFFFILLDLSLDGEIGLLCSCDWKELRPAFGSWK